MAVALLLLSLSQAGQKLWEFTLDGSPPTGTPAVAAGRIFTVADRGSLYALDIDGGRKLWEVKHGCALPRTPVVWGGRLDLK